MKLLSASTGLAVVLTTLYTPAFAQQPPPQQGVYDQSPPSQSAPPPQQVYQDPMQQPPPINYQTFYDALSPYGQWLSNPRYGYVWVPAAGPDFVPYRTDGHWAFTDYGWTWVSDFSWGWAPFHYGRWDYDSFVGWYWIPGYQWSPAWVSWRSSPGYYGWAPLGPAYGYSNYSAYSCPPDRYVFVQNQYITSPVIYSYYVPRNQNATYVTNSSVISTTYVDNTSHSTYYGGPPRAEVEQVTHTTVTPAVISQSSTPGQVNQTRNTISIYRPPVTNPETMPLAQRPVPPKVYQQSEIKPVEQREVLTKPAPVRATPANTQKVNPSQSLFQNPQNKEQRQVNQPNNRVPQRQAAPPNNAGQQRQQVIQPKNNTNQQKQNNKTKPKPVKPAPPKQQPLEERKKEN